MENTYFQLNVQSGSAYAHLNGKMFPLVERCGKRVTLNIGGVSTDFTTKEATELRVFMCDHCGNQKTHLSNITTGYATDTDGKKVCFDCCGELDEQALINLPIGRRYTLYLVRKDDFQWSVENWPGTFSRPVLAGTPRVSRHNIAGKRYDVWFKVAGHCFHGVQYGDNTQIVRARKVKPF